MDVFSTFCCPCKRSGFDFGSGCRRFKSNDYIPSGCIRNRVTAGLRSNGIITAAGNGYLDTGNTLTGIVKIVLVRVIENDTHHKRIVRSFAESEILCPHQRVICLTIGILSLPQSDADLRVLAVHQVFPVSRTLEKPLVHTLSSSDGIEFTGRAVPGNILAAAPGSNKLITGSDHSFCGSGAIDPGMVKYIGFQHPVGMGACGYKQQRMERQRLLVGTVQSSRVQSVIQIDTQTRGLRFRSGTGKIDQFQHILLIDRRIPVIIQASRGNHLCVCRFFQSIVRGGFKSGFSDLDHILSQSS